jgi:ankyrin repeat protein
MSIIILFLLQCHKDIIPHKFISKSINKPFKEILKSGKEIIVNDEIKEIIESEHFLNDYIIEISPEEVNALNNLKKIIDSLDLNDEKIYELIKLSLDNSKQKYLDYLLKKYKDRIDINYKYSNGNTIMHLALINSLKISEILKMNPDLSIQNIQGETILLTALKNNRISSFNKILDKMEIDIYRANAFKVNIFKISILHLTEDIDIIEKLMSKDLDSFKNLLQLKDINGNTPLHLFFLNKNSDILKMLFCNSALSDNILEILSFKNKSGRTPLFVNNQQDVIDLIINLRLKQESIADLLLMFALNDDTENMTFFLESVNNKNIDIKEILNKKDLYVKNHSMCTLFHFVSSLDMMLILEPYVSNLEEILSNKNSDGYFPWHMWMSNCEKRESELENMFIRYSSIISKNLFTESIEHKPKEANTVQDGIVTVSTRELEPVTIKNKSLLHLASSLNITKSIEKVFDRDFKTILTSTDIEGNSALHSAALIRDKELCEYLIKKGLNVHYKNGDKISPANLFFEIDPNRKTDNIYIKKGKKILNYILRALNTLPKDTLFMGNDYIAYCYCHEIETALTSSDGTNERYFSPITSDIVLSLKKTTDDLSPKVLDVQEKDESNMFRFINAKTIQNIPLTSFTNAREIPDFYDIPRIKEENPDTISVTYYVKKLLSSRLTPKKAAISTSKDILNYRLSNLFCCPDEVSDLIDITYAIYKKIDIMRIINVNGKLKLRHDTDASKSMPISVSNTIRGEPQMIYRDRIPYHPLLDPNHQSYILNK